MNILYDVWLSNIAPYQQVEADKSTHHNSESEGQAVHDHSKVIYTSKGKISLDVVIEALHNIKNRDIKIPDFVILYQNEFKKMQQRTHKQLIRHTKRFRHWKDTTGDQPRHQFYSQNWDQDSQGFDSIDFRKEPEYNTLDQQYDVESKEITPVHKRNSR